MDKEGLNGYFIKIINSVHKSLCCCQNKTFHIPVWYKMELQVWFGFSTEESY